MVDRGADTLEARGPGLAWAEMGVGIGVLILAAIVGWQTSSIPAVVYAKVGPSLGPWVLTGALGGLGALLVLAGLRGGWEHEQSWDLDWRALTWLGFGMLFNVSFIEGVAFGGQTILPALGFIICSIVLFTSVARAFGSERPMRDLGIAALFALTAYAAFDGVLGYKIGVGGLDPIVSAAVAKVQALLSSLIGR